MPSPAAAAPLVILGTHSVGDKKLDPMTFHDEPSEVKAYLDIFAKHGGTHIDTSRMYGHSEDRLRVSSAGDRFTIDTKVMSVDPGSHTKAKVLQEIDASLATLGIKQINTAYLHMPDRTTPFEEFCEAMNQAYTEDKIRQWGLSNYSAAEVQTVLDICTDHNWKMPSIYQGPYNAIVRSGERELLPLLRKHGISFYAYSPSAAGFFALSGRYKKEREGTRFDKKTIPGVVHSAIYDRPAVVTAVEKAVAVAGKYDMGGHEAALRWAMYHGILDRRHGDALLVSGSSLEQLESSLDMIEQGPLPSPVSQAFEAIYEETRVDQVSYYIKDDSWKTA